MSSWKKVRLGDYIHEYSKRNKDNANIPVYSVTNTSGFCTEFFSKEVASKDKTTYKIVKKGFFAYNPSRINVGSVDWLRDMDRVIVSPLYNVFFVDSALDQQYLYYYLKCPVGLFYIKELASGSVRDNLKFSILSDFIIPFPDLTIQKDIAATLDRIVQIINICNTILDKIDLLVKSRFVEMFGDLHINSKGWEYAKFTDIADIDGTMTTDFEKYANYPHIGIDSIQKNTGDLIGYRTVSEDNVVSGKYLFSPKHIIYSKIRPNLNKVALPTFNGVCSADAYPILPIDGKCNRTFLAYVMRSDYFLNYILQFCMRTNLPKVNRKELSGFVTPLPSLNLQNQFADFVTQIDKSKLAVKQILEKAETLKKSLMQEYFG